MSLQFSLLQFVLTLLLSLLEGRLLDCRLVLRVPFLEEPAQAHGAIASGHFEVEKDVLLDHDQAIFLCQAQAFLVAEDDGLQSLQPCLC